MLIKQRRIAIGSLLVGVSIAGISTGWTRLHTESVDARVAKRLADCKAASSTGSVIPITPEEFKRAWAAKHATGGHWVPDIPEQSRGHWVPIAPECNSDEVRAVFTNEVQESNAAANYKGLAIVVIFCVPLLWYFLLDRLREISDAILHRDQ